MIPSRQSIDKSSEKTQFQNKKLTLNSKLGKEKNIHHYEVGSQGR